MISESKRLAQFLDCISSILRTIKKSKSKISNEKAEPDDAQLVPLCCTASP